MKRKSRKFRRKKDRIQIRKNWHLSASSSLAIKKRFARIWVKEKRFTRYRYDVETCTDGSTIYLTRPTRTSGVDFQVRVEGFESSKSKSDRPSHADIVRDLKHKIRTNPRLKAMLFAALCDVYGCRNPAYSIRRYPKLSRIKAGLPIDKILRIIKWLFIEQDMAYWLGTGRNMLMSHLEKKVFGFKFPDYD